MKSFVNYEAMLKFVEDQGFSLEELIILQHIENDGIIFMLNDKFYDCNGVVTLNDELSSYIEDKFLTYIS